MALTAPYPGGWYADPDGRHQHRYWDGTTWTEHVSDAGVQDVESLPLEAKYPAPVAAAPASDGESGNSTRDAAPVVGSSSSDGGRGEWGDGATAPLYACKASRLKGGPAFTPNVIRIWPDRVEEYRHHALRQKDTNAIHFARVAQVIIRRGPSGLTWGSNRAAAPRSCSSGCQRTRPRR